ncbi:MAG: MurR/RpiR family transcriptional regulator [Armatimonadota bacterium]|nr:MurR/RpiR family transcriptional regulator [bacterium]MDW8322264.1 MurR/RpiR family transcriptional regulator [Armatimonadota bacterium]
MASVLEKVSALYTSLNEAERRVADFVLNHPEEARGCSVIHLSDRSGVSETTVVRFCRSIGFKGYADFKLALVAELAPHREAPPELHGDVSTEDDLPRLVQKVVNMDVQALASTMELLDVTQFELAVDALANARRVAIFGVGSSLPVCMDLQYRLQRCGVNTLFSVDDHMQAINAALLQPGDVGLAVSYSGESRETIDSVELAKESGAQTICVTSFRRSSLAKLCDICLITSAGRTKWLDENITVRLVQLALFDALCVALARLKRAEAMPLLERIARAVEHKRRQS